jgi:hypothetical protein
MSKFIAGVVSTAIPVIIGVIGTLAAPAVGSPGCMTQAEARKAFPRDHIYWHGPQRCWDNQHRSRKPAADAVPAGSPAKPSEINKSSEINKPSAIGKPSAVDKPGEPIIVPPVRFIGGELRRGLSWPALDISADDVPARAQQDEPLPPAPPSAPEEDVAIGAPDAAPGSPEYLLEHCCWPPASSDRAHGDALLGRMVIATTSASVFVIGLWLFVHWRRRAAVRVRDRNNFSGSRILRPIPATVSPVARPPRRRGAWTG